MDETLSERAERLASVLHLPDYLAPMRCAQASDTLRALAAENAALRTERDEANNALHHGHDAINTVRTERDAAIRERDAQKSEAEGWHRNFDIAIKQRNQALLDLDNALARVRLLEGALDEITSVAEAECGIPTDDDGDDEPVAMCSDGPSPMTFGILRRARAALADTAPAGGEGGA